jgi:hypothetical protein
VRADDAHISLQDIEQLRDLVQGPVPQESAHSCDAGIIPGYLQPQALVLSAHHHGTELVAAENLAVFAHPLLDVQHRAAIIELEARVMKGKMRKRKKEASRMPKGRLKSGSLEMLKVAS